MSPAWLGSKLWCSCLHKVSPSAAAATSSQLLGEYLVRSDLALSELRKGSLVLLVSLLCLFVIPCFIEFYVGPDRESWLLWSMVLIF